jgi:hypothetical protein
MKLLLLAIGAVGVWLVLRRRGLDGRRVVVTWEDGSELEFGTGSPERERLVEIAGEVLR